MKLYKCRLKIKKTLTYVGVFLLWKKGGMTYNN